VKRSEIEQLLPRVYQSALGEQGPLVALLAVMEELHAPAETLLASIESTFSPYRTPESFVPYLSQWVDLDRFFRDGGRGSAGHDAADALSTGNGRLRELMAAAAYLSQWRGTQQGLRRCLETATGVSGFKLDEQVRDSEGLPRPYHIRVSAPQVCAQHRTLIERIVEQEKPAYVTYELVFA